MSDVEKNSMSSDNTPKEETSPPKPPSFPEGGVEAIYEAYYQSTFLPNESASNIAWIGSLQAFFMFSAGLISGPLMDRDGPRILGLFLTLWALFTPLFYVPDYAQTVLGLDVDRSNDLVAIMNAGSFAGRLLTGALANRIGRFNGLVLASAISGVLILCWRAVNSKGSMVVFALLFGFFSGAAIGLFPATVAMTAPRPNVIGSYMGMALGVLSLAGLTGTPITGAMITRSGGYEAAMVFAGVSALVGAGVIAVARVRLAGWVWVA
ncbi:MFS general substrate transporter [Aspergillus indologenus CBS 114.80]|uniref:MFS general substrate transporter n=1 Tax=Aspergillus indologenus CBS 114.80 TaxID=1450541 RepID=A0A2V5IBY8_9EURO|nr:MFS general substrate transporter [Aspergillus indologenus CBS 114.80]